MPNQTIVFSFTAENKPGVVSLLSTTVKEHHGNWLESRVSHLETLFSGLVSISIDDQKTTALHGALKDLSKAGVTIERFEIITPTEATTISKRIELIGPDRSGIIKEISLSLAQLDLNILSMNTQITSAAMSAELLFSADIEFSCTEEKLEQLEQSLNQVADKLTLDISLGETKTD